MAITVLPTSRVVLSSTFSTRMIPNNAVIVKRDLTPEHAVSMCRMVESEDSCAFENRINPLHTSTAELGKLLCSTPAEGGFVELGLGDTMVIIFPSKASRDATEFDVKMLEECDFQVVQRIG